MKKVNFFEGCKIRASKETKAKASKLAGEEKEDNVTRNARETRDNDGELMLANTHSHTRTHGQQQSDDSKLTLMWCGAEFFLLLIGPCLL